MRIFILALLLLIAASLYAEEKIPETNDSDQPVSIDSSQQEDAEIIEELELLELLELLENLNTLISLEKTP